MLKNLETLNLKKREKEQFFILWRIDVFSKFFVQRVPQPERYTGI